MPIDRVAALVQASGLDTDLSFPELEEVVASGVALAVQAAIRLAGGDESREDVALLRAAMTREIVRDVLSRSEGTWTLCAAAASDCPCAECEQAREMVAAAIADASTLEAPL